MLGFHPKLRHDLEKHGQRALAKVREAKRTRVAMTTGSAPAERDRGVLTDDEFEAQKRKLLGERSSRRRRFGAA